MGKLEDVKSMIADYEKQKRQIDRNNSDINLKKQVEDIDKQLKPIDLHIQRLEQEKKNMLSNTTNAFESKQLADEYDRQIAAAKNDPAYGKLNNQKKILNDQISIGRKDRQDSREKQNRDLDDNMLRRFTQESMSIDSDIKSANAKVQAKLAEMSSYKYQYDANGNVINGDGYRKLVEEYRGMQDNLRELKQAKELCDKTKAEINQRWQKRVEPINNAINNNRASENTRTVKPEPENNFADAISYWTSQYEKEDSSPKSTKQEQSERPTQMKSTIELVDTDNAEQQKQEPNMKPNQWKSTIELVDPDGANQPKNPADPNVAMPKEKSFDSNWAASKTSSVEPPKQTAQVQPQDNGTYYDTKGIKMVNGQPVSIMQDRIKSMLVDEKSDKVVVEMVNGKTVEVKNLGKELGRSAKKELYNTTRILNTCNKVIKENGLKIRPKTLMKSLNPGVILALTSIRNIDQLEYLHDYISKASKSLNYIKNKGESISREEAKPDFDLKHIYQKSYRLDKFLQQRRITSLEKVMRTKVESYRAPSLFARNKVKMLGTGKQERKAAELSAYIGRPGHEQLENSLRGMGVLGKDESLTKENVNKVAQNLIAHNKGGKNSYRYESKINSAIGQKVKAIQYKNRYKTTTPDPTKMAKSQEEQTKVVDKDKGER